MAGLFALLYGAFFGGCSVINKAKIESEANENKKKAIDNNELTYLVRGEMYFTENDLPCLITEDIHTHHRVIKCSYGKHQGKILYDFTQNEINNESVIFKKEINRAIENGKKYLKKYYPTEIYKNGRTGYEINTHRKYYEWLSNNKEEAFYVYLENEPVKIFDGDRWKEIYDVEESEDGTISIFSVKKKEYVKVKVYEISIQEYFDRIDI